MSVRTWPLPASRTTGSPVRPFASAMVRAIVASRAICARTIAATARSGSRPQSPVPDRRGHRFGIGGAPAGRRRRVGRARRASHRRVGRDQGQPARQRQHDDRLVEAPVPASKGKASRLGKLARRRWESVRGDRIQPGVEAGAGRVQPRLRRRVELLHRDRPAAGPGHLAQPCQAQRVACGVVVDLAQQRELRRCQAFRKAGGIRGGAPRRHGAGGRRRGRAAGQGQRGHRRQEAAAGGIGRRQASARPGAAKAEARALGRDAVRMHRYSMRERIGASAKSARSPQPTS